MNGFIQNALTLTAAPPPSSENQALPLVPARARDECVIDGSASATEDDIRKLRQTECFFRERKCFPKNYRPLSGDAHARNQPTQQPQPATIAVALFCPSSSPSGPPLHRFL